MTFLLVAAPLQAADKPNIIHIMVDDAGIGDFTSYFANSPVETPNIDALALRGMKFNRAYASTNCALSRVTLLTGKHNGHATTRINKGSTSLRNSDVTVAEVLKQAGYATSGYGKWGAGAPGTPGAPERQGFDEFVGYYNQRHAHSHFAERLYRNGAPVILPANVGITEPETGLMGVGTHAHSYIYGQMKNFIVDQVEADKPFYTWGAWTPPHRKSTLPVAESQAGGVYVPYANKNWNEFSKIQASFVTWIDRQVGELVEVLEDPNGDGDNSDSVTDNTLLIFTSDNGGWENGGHAWDRNRETVGGQNISLRGSKESMYEGGLRIPMIAVWPGKIPANTESDLLTSFPDFLPTFADVAGITSAVPSDVNGLSILPTLTQTGAQSLHQGLYWERFPSDDANANPIQVGRIGDWKLIRKSSGSLELYDLANDPSETTNVSANSSNATMLTELISFLDNSRTAHRPQINLDPPDVGNGPGALDGIVALGIRPGGEIRDWTLGIEGDPKAFGAGLLDRTGQPVDMYLDDLHFDYQLATNVNRIAEGATQLTFELTGNSGFVYYRGSYDLQQQAAGSTEAVTIDFQITGVSPTAGQVSTDIGGLLSLQVSHDGSLGTIGLDTLQLTAMGQPVFADLDQNAILDGADWELFRENFLRSFAGLTPSESYLLGDLNFDGLSNGADFKLFKSAFNFTNGPGAFTDLLTAVPEPNSASILMVGAFVFIYQHNGRVRHRLKVK